MREMHHSSITIHKQLDYPSRGYAATPFHPGLIYFGLSGLPRLWWFDYLLLAYQSRGRLWSGFTTALPGCLGDETSSSRLNRSPHHSGSSQAFLPIAHYPHELLSVTPPLHPLHQILRICNIPGVNSATFCFDILHVWVSKFFQACNKRIEVGGI